MVIDRHTQGKVVDRHTCKTQRLNQNGYGRVSRCSADIETEDDVGERFDLQGGQFQICKKCLADGRKELCTAFVEEMDYMGGYITICYIFRADMYGWWTREEYNAGPWNVYGWWDPIEDIYIYIHICLSFTCVVWCGLVWFLVWFCIGLVLV